MKLSLSESDCNAPMQLCLACPKYKCGAYGDSGSPMIVKGPDGSHTLVGTVIGGNGKQHFATGERMFAAEVSGKSQSNVINKRRQTGKIFFL